MNRSLRNGLILLGLLVLMAIVPPPLDPVEQVDPVASLYRPPGTLLQEVRLESGAVLLADRVEVRGDQLVLLRNGQQRTVATSEVSNLAPGGVLNHRYYLLGTDRFGRDVWSRMMVGARVSLMIALLAMALASTLGTFIGALAASAGPRVDNLLMRLVDSAMAFPSLFLVLALSAILEPSTAQVVLLLGGTAWMGTCRIARAEFVGLQERDYVLASRGLGQRRLLIVLRHLLPNALTPLVVEATLMVGGLILAEAALSFFGLGVQAPTPSWGNMVSDGRTTTGVVWWAAFFPGLAIALTVIAFNLVADGLRERLDPHHSRARSSGEDVEAAAAPGTLPAP